MATVLQPIVNELNTVLVQLRTELRGLQTDAHGAGIAIPSPQAKGKERQGKARLLDPFETHDPINSHTLLAITDAISVARQSITSRASMAI